ncbi:cytochrome C assembly family protein [Lampropedia aestuarii]|uniref:cytochrome C assembly family protein n=1 Tax=Lampropedia aestuarii TaxID=2562762 RepID=UPI002468E540|nr:cytochrome c biogenesis protein CcsA [Lampropedia aestuarii]MDH5858501.1 cytochrome c biogenesis protein CcsA [Lampropedia aestuarii]
MIVPSAFDPPMLLAIAAALLYGVAAFLHTHPSPHPPRLALLLAWLLHMSAIVSALVVEGARFGFGPALSVTTWLMISVYGIEYHILPRLQPHWPLALIAAAAAVIGAVYPGQPLATNAGPLLAIHLALAIACYGLFAMAVLHGWLMQRAEKQMRNASALQVDGLPLLSLERLTFRFAAAGFVLLTATLVAGLFFGEELYGRAWTWSHKEVFSVLAWLTFTGLLLARWQQGLRGRKAVRILNIGAIFLLLAYVGSRFVMEVVLRT